MEELPEEAIEVAEHISVDHSQDGLVGDDDRLLWHISARSMTSTLPFI